MAELLTLGVYLDRYRLSPAAREGMHRYIQRRREQPYFSNARSIRKVAAPQAGDQ